MTDLPERLRELADSLVCCEWNHPITAADDCRAAAGEIERLRGTAIAVHLHPKLVRDGESEFVPGAERRGGPDQFLGCESVSLDELASQQGVCPVSDINEISGLWPVGDDTDELIRNVSGHDGENEPLRHEVITCP